MLGAFTKIFALGHRMIKNIFDSPVEISEKVDGSQFGFGKINDELVIRSKGQVITYDETPSGMFRLGIEHVKRVADRIPNNSAFYCEFLNKPKHNVLAYNRVPKNNLTLFAVGDPVAQVFDRNVLAGWASTLEIEPIPILYSGMANPEMIIELLSRESFLGGPHIEGVVVKNYDQCFMLGEVFHAIACGKFVSEQFKEKATGWKCTNTSRGTWESYIESFITEARWMKSVQHLRDSGLLIGAPEDIGPLMKEINLDIIGECKDEIKDQLWKLFSKDLLRKSTRGFPDWYKKQLLTGDISI